MIISIASGKGGTGKTTVALNLALAAAGRGVLPAPGSIPGPAGNARQGSGPQQTWQISLPPQRAGTSLSRLSTVQLLDCDVEEPNCHLFLRPVLGPEEPVEMPVPMLDEGRCDGCGECARLCQFKAIACLAGTVLTFPELCHGCGGCILACPKRCLSESGRLLGWRQTGTADGLAFATGRLRVGEAMAAPLIKRVKGLLRPDALNLIDAPPGTACPVIAAVEGSDLVLLVTEPTPFGLNDLELAVGMARVLGLPCGVVINREGLGDDRVERYCRREAIPVLGRLPHDMALARAYSRGELALRLPGWREIFEALLDDVVRAAGQGTPKAEEAGR